MEVIGIIAEYNPFHNGHLYQINTIKNIYPDSIIIAIIDGYFGQRGDMAIITKEDKVKDALSNNVDIVIELPVLFAIQSADTFANNSLLLLNELKITKLCFGSESNNLKMLYDIANKQLDDKFNHKVKEYLKKGLNYPTALKNALDIEFNYNNPNDLLAISYIKSIINNNYNIDPIPIKRTNDYHDLSNSESIISASNIRHRIINNENVFKYVPIVNEYHYNDYYKYLKLCIYNSNLKNILDIEEGIDNKIINEITKARNLEELIKKIKSKRFTYNRLNRMLNHILLGISKDDAILKPDYLRILGFSKDGKKYLNKIKKDFGLPLYNNKIKSKIKDYEIKSSIIYDLINDTNTYLFEIKNKPIN